MHTSKRERSADSSLRNRRHQVACVRRLSSFLPKSKLVPPSKEINLNVFMLRRWHRQDSLVPAHAVVEYIFYFDTDLIFRLLVHLPFQPFLL